MFEKIKLMRNFVPNDVCTCKSTEENQTKRTNSLRHYFNTNRKSDFDFCYALR